uniref:RING-type domain-containing protein n=1 Tax=Electrophorus electricus TaxID=8005 RepID=A0A4W4EKA0_ELEEL
MPIRAYCTICSDFFDHSKDVAAIHCGHTFHYVCLLQWFQSAPTKTCPQCRKQVSTRHIINKLFFDIAAEDEGSATDPEIILHTCAPVILQKQLQYLESQHRESESAKEEAKRLRIKMKTYESLHVVLQGQRAEVEAMISDMGVGQSAVEQLSIYCISLKKEYENLKGGLKSSNEMCEKLKRDVFSSNNKLQKTIAEKNKLTEDMKSLQNDLTNADKEVTSLKKKVEILQKTLSTPTRTNEAISRLVLESPAPLELKPPRLHPPIDSQDIDLNLTFDINTPEQVEKRSIPMPMKKMRLELTELVPYLSIIFKPNTHLHLLLSTLRSMCFPHFVRTGYDGFGGRTKFIQPSPLAEMRPHVIKAKRKKVSRPVASKLAPNLTTLDGFLE